LGYCKPFTPQNYMKNHVSEKVMASAEPSIALGELRQHVVLALIGNSLFSEAEHLRAHHFVHECEDLARLTRWGANVLTEIAHRQAEAAHKLRYLATSATLRRFRSSRFLGHRSRPRRPKPTWVPGVFFPDRSDRWAATRFRPADALPFASLLSRQSR
jgi:hypothetical protein